MVQTRLVLQITLLQVCSIKSTSFWVVNSATNTYTHRNILEVLLNYDKEAAESQLGCELFCKDTADQMEEMDITADPVLNTGLGTRSEWTKTGKTVELQDRTHSDLFNQDKIILNRVDLTVKLHCHKPEFCLLSADTAPAYKIITVEARSSNRSYGKMFP